MHRHPLVFVLAVFFFLDGVPFCSCAARLLAFFKDQGFPRRYTRQTFALRSGRRLRLPLWRLFCRRIHERNATLADTFQ
ncbi:UNVERIFIED_CONTAM: hypothetical protein HHA_312105 [Hammondia hammondi]|eukprot:XP_008885813.1 hypothetical protein HHA_312105 [Hammondia hammondi]